MSDTSFAIFQPRGRRPEKNHAPVPISTQGLEVAANARLV